VLYNSEWGRRCHISVMLDNVTLEKIKVDSIKKTNNNKNKVNSIKRK
jgi:hypothetical protein